MYLDIRGIKSVVKDLKKLLDDHNKYLKTQGGSGGGLPQELVSCQLANDGVVAMHLVVAKHLEKH